MALKPEQIGRDRRICNMDGKAIKQATNRWRRRRWKQNSEAHLPKYKGWAS